MKKFLIPYLSCAIFLTAGGVLAHEGHNEAFGGNAVTAVSEKIFISEEGQVAIGLETAVVTEERLGEVVQVSGKVEPADGGIFQISPKVAGVVSAIHVKENDAVKAGQTLATIYSAELAGILGDLLQERNAIQTEIARLQTRFQGEIASQRQEVELARERYEREKSLLDEGITARKDFRQAEKEFETARIRLDALQQQSTQEAALLKNQLAVNIGSVKSQLRVMGVPEGSVNRALASNSVIADVPLVAPASGVVSARDITLGMAVKPGETAFTVVDLSPIWVHLDVYQEQIPRVQPGQTVRLVTASNVVLTGKVDSISPVVEPDQRTVPVRVVAHNPAGLLKPGLFVNAEIMVGRGEGSVVVVPLSAVVEQGGRTLVFVKYGNEFQSVAVTPGRKTAGQVEVLEGLYEGDEVVVHGARQIYAQSLLGDQSETETPDNTGFAPDWLQILLGLMLGLGIGGIAWVIGRNREQEKTT